MFFPFGSASGEVIDPDLLAREFTEAAAAAGDTNQWNWIRDALAVSKAKFIGKDLVNAQQTFVACDLQSVQGAAPILPDTVGADVNLWKVPFKRGYSTIGEGTPSGGLTLTWETEYPELVMVVLSYQYVRVPSFTDITFVPALTYRFQGRIQVDGAVMPGTGPFGIPANGNFRTSGYAPSAAAISVVWIGVLPAGAHVAEGVAGQADWAKMEPVTVSTGANKMKIADSAPVEGVCVGNRSLLVVRFPRGTPFQG